MALVGIDYTSPLTSDGLIAEVASGMFAFKNKIKAANIRLLWEKLSIYIGDTIRSQKGVLLPNLGNFKVGPVVGESKKKIRPIFTLLEGRYGKVSQERPKYMIGGKAPVVQPNYGLLSNGAVIHRAACQRLLAELLQRLGIHLLSGRPIRTELPTVGTMVTNRAGRFEFVFDPLLLEFFEREHYALIREMAYTPEDYDLARGVKALHLDKRSPQGPHHSALRAAGGRDRMHYTPLKATLHALLKKCRESDRIGSGCIQRMTLEKWLQSDCRPVLARLDAASIMDLLDRHAYGKTSKQVLYTTFVKALEEMVAPIQAFGDDPSHLGDQEPQHHGAHVYNDDMEPDHEASLIHPHGAERHAQNSLSVPLYDFQGQHQQQPSHQELQQQQHQQHYPPHHLPPSPQYPPPSSQYPPATPQQYPSPPAQQQYQQYQQHQQRHSSPPPQQQQQYQLEDPHFVPPVPPTPLYSPPPVSAVDPEDYLHYNQNLVSPRSRAAYDEFNRMHFEKLFKSRGPAPKRAITPKVGQETLNVVEYNAISSEQRGSTPSDFLHRKAPFQNNQASSGAPYDQYYDLEHHPQVLRVSHGSSRGGAVSPSQAGAAVTSQRAVGQAPGSARHYDILAPPPLPSPNYQPQVAPVSQYDIAAEANPARRARLREEYAAQCRQGWEKQIREREAVEEELQEKGTKWPFAPTHDQDKRPASAISRPPVSPRHSRTPYK